jgi:hypothetical protein
VWPRDTKCARVDSNHWPHPPEASPPGRPAPTSAELRGFFVLDAGPASHAGGRCVTQSVTPLAVDAKDSPMRFWRNVFVAPRAAESRIGTLRNTAVTKVRAASCAAAASAARAGSSSFATKSGRAPGTAHSPIAPGNSSAPARRLRVRPHDLHVRPRQILPPPDVLRIPGPHREHERRRVRRAVERKALLPVVRDETRSRDRLDISGQSG